MLDKSELHDFLEAKVLEYNQPKFIDSDPISIPHQFSKKEDIEIAGFLSATIAWGNRKAIIKAANQLIELMDNSPYDFVLNHNSQDLQTFVNWKYRTFNPTDLIYFLTSLKNIYKNHNGLESAFWCNAKTTKEAIINFRNVFFEIEHPARTTKHISNPAKNSSAKRLNMYLRWMHRDNNNGVDFGIWNNNLKPLLHCPLDVHSGRVARKLGILNRKQDDWKAVEELSSVLRSFDENDPSKYDFALFGLGVFEKF